MHSLFLEINWRIFYSFLTYFLTLIICIDSWEYLLIYETDFLASIDFYSNSFVFSKIQDGQKLVYLVAIYYSFLIGTFFVITHFFLLILPAMFKIEVYQSFFFILFYANILLAHILNNKFLFPLICKDLLQYQYNNLNDRVLNISVEYLMNINDILLLKYQLFFLFSGMLNFFLILYLLQMYYASIFYYIIKHKKRIIISVFLIFLIFFENDIYLIGFFFCLVLFLLEFYTLLIFLLKKYNNIYKIR